MTKVIAVVRGGVSHESDKSNTYGKQVLIALNELGYIAKDLYLHPNGSFTLDGYPIKIKDVFSSFEYVWNCLVGVDGESGLVEELCEKYKVKLLGHSKISVKMAGDKNNFLKAAKVHKLKTPYSHVVSQSENSENLKQSILKAFAVVGIPAVVKPKSGSGLHGVQIVNNYTEMESAILKLNEKGDDAVVEKLIKGIPVSIFVMEHGNLMHTNIHIYGDEKVSKDDLINIRNEALYLHNVLAFKHHVEYDFVFTNKGIYLIEANTHPSLSHYYIKDFFRDNVVSLKDYILDKIK